MNVGLNLFRILLTLGVIMDHFWWTPDPGAFTGVEKAIWQMRTLAVPAFMTMTFFFTARRFVSGDFDWLKKRFRRLYEPFVFWAIVSFAVITVGSWCGARYRASFVDLLWQLAFGHSSHLLLTQFWFHMDLIVFTAVFFLGFRWVKTPRATIYLSLAAIAVGYSVQYSAATLKALVGWMPEETMYPIGRLFPMLPYVGVGLLLAMVREKLDAASTGVRIALAALGLWLAFFTIYAPLCPTPPSVVGYEGIKMGLIAWGLFFAFYYLPFDRLPPVWGKAVLFVSRYCMGVYCIHRLLGSFLFDHLFHIPRTQGITVAPGWFWLMLWALCYLVCYLISLIPVKFLKRTVE